MKKTLIIIAIIFSLGISSMAQTDGFFNDYYDFDNRYENVDLPSTPGSHGLDNNIDAPIGNGLLILAILGVGYAMRKKDKVEL